MLNNLVFLVVVFLANIVQGITGFAGTILAMPFGIFLLNLGAAKAVLNVVGLSATIQVSLISRQYINLPIIKKVALIMGPGVIIAFFIVDMLKDYENIQRLILGILVVVIGSLNLLKGLLSWRLKVSELALNVILFLAGIFHGMFICGGPLLVIYMAKKLPDKNEFRATISAIWVIFNFIILLQHLYSGYFDKNTLLLCLAAIPLVALSVSIGSLLLKKLSQVMFINITNLLLIISGIVLIIN